MTFESKPMKPSFSTIRIFAAAISILFSGSALAGKLCQDMAKMAWFTANSRDAGTSQAELKSLLQKDVKDAIYTKAEGEVLRLLIEAVYKNPRMTPAEFQFATIKDCERK